MDPSSLRARWDALLADSPGTRARDAAEQLGVSEGELLASRVGHTVTRLVADGPTLLKALEGLGELMGLTRNPHAVIEKQGPYTPQKAWPRVGLVTDTDGIDLRLFFEHWSHAFATVIDSRRGPLPSIQVFDRSGTAVHKVYVMKEAGHAAYHEAIAELAAEDQTPGIAVETIPPKVDKPDAEVDVERLRSGWRELKDTHDFHGLLLEAGAGRRQALRLAPEGYTKQVPTTELLRVLETAAEREVPIMVFVGNRGGIEIHSGPVKRVVAARGWVNVLDPGFDLHVREAGLHDAWWVRKPTEDGDVHSLEVFDEAGALIVQLFGARKPGIPELESWREVLTG